MSKQNLHHCSASDKQCAAQCIRKAPRAQSNPIPAEAATCLPSLPSAIQERWSFDQPENSKYRFIARKANIKNKLFLPDWESKRFEENLSSHCFNHFKKLNALNYNKLSYITSVDEKLC